MNPTLPHPNKLHLIVPLSLGASFCVTLSGSLLWSVALSNKEYFLSSKIGVLCPAITIIFRCDIRKMAEETTLDPDVSVGYTNSTTVHEQISFVRNSQTK